MICVFVKSLESQIGVSPDSLMKRWQWWWRRWFVWIKSMMRRKILKLPAGWHWLVSDAVSCDVRGRPEPHFSGEREAGAGGSWGGGWGWGEELVLTFTAEEIEALLGGRSWDRKKGERWRNTKKNNELVKKLQRKSVNYYVLVLIWHNVKW